MSKRSDPIVTPRPLCPAHCDRFAEPCVACDLEKVQADLARVRGALQWMIDSHSQRLPDWEIGQTCDCFGCKQARAALEGRALNTTEYQ